MGVLRCCPMPIGTAHSSQSRTQSPPPWTNSTLKQRRRWRLTCKPLKSPVCALDTSSGEQSGGLTKNSTEFGTPTLTSASTLPGIEQGWEVTNLAPDADPTSITEWELDFCSRPILDIRGKKIWELVVCDSGRNLEFTRFYPNNAINSITLKNAIMSIVDTFGVPKPQRIRFFRSQMQTIVSKACNEVGIKPIASKRCISLVRWLEERYESVYMHHPGFQEGAKPLLTIEQPFPLDLPDSLCGEKWAFVQLPLAAIREEMLIVQQGSTFGSVLDLDVLEIDLSDDTLIPGVAVTSSRATALAAWTNALEIASIDVDRQRACLVLSAGVSKRWRYAFYRKNRQTDHEADAWEAAKKACGGLHFLAIQDSLDSDSCTGFWLILEMPSPPV
uniref:TSA: Wollemia nobilis Ref_Wollemi_Transcript_9878_1291 transcribed RNA sequence n=1 Tax=Wollemia nobilis TaxID=56998 RepID=A0A0C9S904_9CONI